MSAPRRTPSTPRPAVELLLWCARRIVAGEDREPPPPLDLSDDEWRFFMREALRHSCLPIVARALAAASGVPEVIAADLETAFEANAHRNLGLAGELIGATRLLAAAGVTAASWKGPVLAERAYGDLRLRQFFDLDLLVRRGDLVPAVRVLADLGFRPEHAMSAAQQAAYVDHMGELELVRESDGLWLELHTAVVPSYFGRGRSADEMLDRLRPFRLARADVVALDPVDELEALCVHGSKHVWERLEWIVDVAMLARRLDDADMQRLVAGARRRGTWRMVATGLLLAGKVVDARLHDDVMRLANADGANHRLAASAARSLFAPRTGRAAELSFHVQMWSTTSDRWRYLANVLMTPSVADWEFVSLPRPLVPLYPLVRPFRMARDGVRAFSRRDRNRPVRR